MASKNSGERKSHMPLTLSDKLQMINLSEEDISKSEKGLKLGLLYQLVNCEYKQKFLSEIKSAMSVNMKQSYC